jgi:hypothetical protein
MKRLLVVLALVAVVVPAGARTRNVTINVEDNERLTSCNQINVRFDHSDGYRAEENLPVAGVRSLKISAAQNGGIYVTEGGSYGVRVCKVAESESGLREMTASVRGNEVVSDGPGDGNWVMYFIVTIPRNGTIDMETHNGPIALYEVTATVNARATNGPISARRSAGTLDLSTQNGPISLTGGNGTVKLNAQNGPISVKLEDTFWNGSLDARTQNGPLSVRLPRNFRSGTVIESDGHGPMTCRAEICREARRTWDEDDDRSRRIEFGSGPTIVHMSTTNGPVSVKEAE